MSCKRFWSNVLVCLSPCQQCVVGAPPSAYHASVPLALHSNAPASASLRCVSHSPATLNHCFLPHWVVCCALTNHTLTSAVHNVVTRVPLPVSVLCSRNRTTEALHVAHE